MGNPFFLHKNVDNKIELFKEILINIFSNFVPHKAVTINDEDLPWMTQSIKDKIQWKNSIYKQFVKSNKSQFEFLKLRRAISEVSDLISQKKNDYYNHLSEKVNNPKTRAKTYWSILKTFYNGKKVLF